ncbi:MAG: TRAP transporter substrate-binding protein DctP [Treponema sp.]|nr:TRAP transporter substrate-binding protein DctP [Treponema sp.]
MKKIRCLLLCLTLIFVMLPIPVFAQRKVTIKLVSLVPENTPWGNLLNRLSVEWKEATNGEVTLQIYHNNQSNEADVIRKLNMNQIQAAVLSTLGMKLINPPIMTLSCPFLIRDNQELDVVLNALKPEMEKGINDKGYFTLAWSKIGWVRFFSKSPVFVPADLKKQKLGTIETEQEMMDIFKAMGYQMTPVATEHILVNLSGGLIDAVYQSPVIAGGLQIFGLARNMASIPVAPFLGSIVMTQRAWRSIPEKYRPELLRLVKRVEAELDHSVQALENEVIDTMVRYGLVINQVSPQQAALWYADTARAMPSLIGSTFDKALYERITSLLEAHRARR